MRRAAVVFVVLVVATIIDGPTRNAQAVRLPADLSGTRGSWLQAGDSFSSGQGLDTNLGPCARSSAAYASLALERAAPLSTDWSQDDVTCSGDLIDNFRIQAAEATKHFNDFSYNEQSLPQACQDQLNFGPTAEDWTDAIKRGGDHLARWTANGCSGQPSRYDIITFTFGGDDIAGGFGDVIKGCLKAPLAGWGAPLPRSSCPSESYLRDEVQRLTGSGSGVVYNPAKNHSGISYATFVREVARDYLKPGGRLYVLGYPRLFANSDDWPWYDFFCQFMRYDKADMFGRLANQLHDALKSQVDAAQRVDPRIRYIDMYWPSRNGKHELCGDGQDWLNGVVLGTLDPAQSFHPNAAGNDAEADLLVDEIEKFPPSASPTSTTSTTTTRPSASVGSPITGTHNFYALGADGFTLQANIEPDGAGRVDLVQKTGESELVVRFTLASNGDGTYTATPQEYGDFWNRAGYTQGPWLVGSYDSEGTIYFGERSPGALDVQSFLHLCAPGAAQSTVDAVCSGGNL